MTRKAHDAKLVRRAKELRDVEGKTYAGIAERLFIEHGIWVGESTIRDWVTYRTRCA